MQEFYVMIELKGYSVKNVHFQLSVIKCPDIRFTVIFLISFTVFFCFKHFKSDITKN